MGKSLLMIKADIEPAFYLFPLSYILVLLDLHLQLRVCESSYINEQLAFFSPLRFFIYEKCN